jgi:hypothetical protein
MRDCIQETKTKVAYIIVVYYMGAGILPATIIKGKLYFMFGKENQHEVSAPGWSDFGGGKDGNETLKQTAIREGGEELTGFLGDDLNQLMKRTWNIDSPDKKYRTHIFRMDYDPMLIKYYNNNQRFIQTHLDASIIKQSKIFEKAEIQWICVDDLLTKKNQFRHFFVPLLETIIGQKKQIRNFIQTGKTRKVRFVE